MTMANKKYKVTIKESPKSKPLFEADDSAGHGNIPITDVDLQQNVSAIDTRVAQARKIYNNEVLKANNELELIRKEQVKRNEEKARNSEKKSDEESDSKTPDTKDVENPNVGGSSQPAGENSPKDLVD